MFTLFDLLKLIAAVACSVLGGRYGYHAFGWSGAIIGLSLGFVVGMFMGNLPWVISWAWMRSDLKRCSVEKLKGRLSHEYFISHLLIGELVSRGEPLEQFRDYVIALLRSDSAAERHFGNRIACAWFPDLVQTPLHPSASTPRPDNGQ